jgi:hypothetical protein
MFATASTGSPSNSDHAMGPRSRRAKIPSGCAIWTLYKNRPLTISNGQELVMHRKTSRRAGPISGRTCCLISKYRRHSMTCAMMGALRPDQNVASSRDGGANRRESDPGPKRYQSNEHKSSWRRPAPPTAGGGQLRYQGADKKRSPPHGIRDLMKSNHC